MSEFGEWAKRWIALAAYPGATFPSDGRIDAVIELYRECVPTGWQRELGRDKRLRDKERFTRRPRGELAPEAVIEATVLSKDVPPTEIMGEPIVDGVNAVPLVLGQGRAGDVEADLLLLTGAPGAYRLVVGEVKVNSNHAWYAAVENLRQVRLVAESPVRGLFHERQPELPLGDAAALPVAGAVIAPQAFYSAPGQKAGATGPARELFRRIEAELEIAARLVVWSGDLSELG
jgi:hypothetical protein